MENFTMYFTHPIKGVIRFFKPGANCASYIINVDTKQSETLDIPLTGIAKGNWELVLNWEHEEKQYAYSRNLSIT